MSEQEFHDASLDELIESAKEDLQKGVPVAKREDFQPELPAEYADLVSDEELEEAPEQGMPGVMKALLYVCLVLLAAVLLAVFAWKCADEICALTAEEETVTVTVPENARMSQIIDNLSDAGLIEKKWLFRLYCMVSGAENKIDPGTYELSTVYDYRALVYGMIETGENRATRMVTVPEGYELDDIFSMLEEMQICDVHSLQEAAASYEYDYWFLKELPYGDYRRLEGYLFPDTYEFYKNSTPREALQRMLNNFENRFSEEMRAQIDVLNEELTGNYTVREITIVASLIEKESAAPAESPKVAGVIYNRLFNWDSPAYLNIDASIVYAQGGVAETIDTNLDSPYNTYTNVGLTPGPISNPGLASLRAALNPESHDYYYYVLNPSTGMHQFSESLAQHNAYIREFYGE